jgi:hypothetical protein
MFDKKLFKYHLEKARNARSEYDAFDARWKAFNVYYESLFQRRQRRELDRVHLAAKALSHEDYQLFLTPATTKKLVTIAPVFNERDWQRRGVKSTADHAAMKTTLTGSWQRKAPTEADVLSLLTLLYIIRCNMAHGFKTSDGQRDVEVLSAANCVFAPFMDTLTHRIL